MRNHKIFPRKVIVSTILWVILSQVIVYITIDFYKFVAQSNFKLRPELPSLTWWEALWTNHLTDWLWLIDPQKALLFNIITFGVVGLIVGYWVGQLWEVWD